MFRTTLRRLAVATLAPAVVAGTLLAAPSAQADTAQSNATAAWLADELRNGLLHFDHPDFGEFDDYGLTIDTLLALRSVGGYSSKVDDIADALADNVQNYVGYAPEIYANSTAKLLVAVQAAGRNPESFGGLDLVSQLEGRVVASGPTTGRLEDQSEYGDYANVFGQAFAAQGLDAAASTAVEPVTEFLLSQQCSDGSFPTYFHESGAECSDTDPDTDATAQVILSLQSQTDDTDVQDAIDDAVGWLLSEQGDDFSFGGGTSTEAPNTNSTALAAQALAVEGHAEEAGDAAGWIAALQATYHNACGTQLFADRGAVAYDRAALDKARATGITAADSVQWRRSSVPAAAALDLYEAPASLPASPLTVTGPTGFVQGGKAATIAVTGLAPGEWFCVSGVPGAGGQADDTGTATAKVTPVIATGNVTVAVAGSRASRNGSTTLKVLGKRTLPLSLKHSTVKKRTRQVVKVSGLVAGESLTITFSGQKIKTAKALSNGTYTYSFKVGSSTGKKTVKVTGAFSDRTASKTFRIK